MDFDTVSTHLLTPHGQRHGCTFAHASPWACSCLMRTLLSPRAFPVPDAIMHAPPCRLADSNQLRPPAGRTDPTSDRTQTAGADRVRARGVSRACRGSPSRRRRRLPSQGTRLRGSGRAAPPGRGRRRHRLAAARKPAPQACCSSSICSRERSAQAGRWSAERRRAAG